MLDQAKAERITDGIARGELLSDICAEIGVDRTTVWRWQKADGEFATQCARAREVSADVVEEDVARLLGEVRNGDVAPDAARVILNGQTWLAKVRAPKKYGDKLDLAVSGSLSAVIESLPVVSRPTDS